MCNNIELDVKYVTDIWIRQGIKWAYSHFLLIFLLPHHTFLPKLENWAVLCWAQIDAVCLYVCSKSMTGRGFSNIHTCSRGIHTCSRAFFSEFYYNLTWRFLDRGSVFFDFFSLDKPVCPKTICLSCFLDIHATKNQRKRYPCRWIVMLSWVGIAKTLTGRGVLDLSPNIHA